MAHVLSDMFNGFRDVDESASLKFAENIMRGMAENYDRARIDYAQEIELGGRVTIAILTESM